MNIRKELYNCPCYLYCNYILLRQSGNKIANELSCCATTIIRNLKKYNIPRRSTSEAKKGQKIKKRDFINQGKFNDKDWLFDEYYILKKSVPQIAKENNVGQKTINIRFKRFNFEKRDRSFYSKGFRNPAFKDGYWMVRKQHIKNFKKIQCENCGSKKDLVIHHDPYMDETNCLEWEGIVYTLCIPCHMNRHRNNLGQMERIYAE